jgi:hypothetical protein
LIQERAVAGTREELSQQLRSLSGTLQQIHSHILEVERQFDPGLTGLQGVERLAHDPRWTWLRSISSLIADVDHVLASREHASEGEIAAVAAHVRGLVFGPGDPIDEAFLARYRPLLQMSAALASAHGELKRLLDGMPAESENESERLHARHVWAVRCKQRLARVR